MNITIQSIHFDADQKLTDFVSKKLDKLESHTNKIVSAEVYLRVDKPATHNNKITEIKIQIPGHTLFSKEQSSTFEESTDAAVDSLRQQLRRTLDKMRTS
jgi:putative sigma-54 modulation protein